MSQTSASTGKKPEKKRRLAGWIVLGVLVALLASGALYGWLYLRPIYLDLRGRYERVSAIAEQLEQAAKASPPDLKRGMELVDEASEQVEAIRAEVSPYYPTLERIHTWRWIGKPAGQVEPTVEYAHHMLQAAAKLKAVIQPVLDDKVYDKRSSKLIQAINAGQDQIRGAEDELDQAEKYYSRIHAEDLPERFQGKVKKLEKIHEYMPLLEEGLEDLKLVPQFSGAGKPVTYLILLQNSDELRPTGGFITAIGLLRLENGVVTVLELKDTTSDNYISQYVEAPAPLKQILLAHYWLPRDANWSPSFPESAQKVQELYQLSTGIETQGVIALTQSSLRSVLAYTGPITVDGVQVSQENVLEYMISEKMEAVSAGNSLQRKEFITPLAKVMLDALAKKSGMSDIQKLAHLVKGMAASGELMVYMNDDTTQDLVRRYHFDGSVEPGSGDYIMLVDANLGINKADQSVRRSLEYSVDLTNPRTPSGQISITYQNPMQGDVICHQAGDIRKDVGLVYSPPSCYWDYWRVLGPTGAKVTNSVYPPFDDTAFEKGFSWPHDLQTETVTGQVESTGGLLVLPVNSQTTIQLSRAIPTAALRDDGDAILYRLVVQKQAGVDRLPFKFSLVVPEGYHLDPDKASGKFSQQGNRITWQSDLTASITEISLRLTSIMK